MKTPGLAEMAARLLADSRSELPDRPLEPVERELAIAAVGAAIEARAKQRARRRWAVGALAAAAVVAVGVGVTAVVREATRKETVARAAALPPAAVLHVEAGGVDVTGAGGRADGAAIGQGSRLVARPDGRATLALSTGTQLTLEERADVTIVAEGATQRFSLTGGAVRAHVAKLAQGERFIIATADAEIEVRGTSFRVSVVPADAACGDGTPTRVDVVEGTVVVRHAGQEASVGAGQSWPEGCAPPVAPSSVGASPSAAAPRPSASAASRLAEQNDLFADAIADKRRGDNAAAIATFERFLAKYPASPLAESASVERMKLLALSDRARARAAAAQYLARYPHGYARDDAERIAAP